MKNYAERLAAFGIAIPDLLIPNLKDLSKWAVIACDQGTQDREYWKSVGEIAGNDPSSLNLIFPEIYLDDPGADQRIAAIHNSMDQYLKTAIFRPPQKTLIYLERDTPFNKKRMGLVLLMDLENYEYKINTRPLIRPSEGTVPERLPPRVKIRQNAPLETPHILALIDDQENFLLPALGEAAKKKAPIYDFELMLGAGRLRGWTLDQEAHWNNLALGLERLAKEKPFFYAVGDGNHSMATAKAVWEEYKTAHHDDPEIMSHPARWILVELENLYDPALQFEPIHRFVFGVDAENIKKILSKELPGYSCNNAENSSELSAWIKNDTGVQLKFGLLAKEQFFKIQADPAPLAIDVIQPLLDKLILEYGGNANLDYIHGSEEVFRLALDSNLNKSMAAGILLPPFRKQGLFKTIEKSGPLPRKSFSMGESCEKRFYLECRKLF